MKWLLAMAAATAALLGAACSAEAEAPAQPVKRIVAFGDSYADDGNIFELHGVEPDRIYPKGRFSNGTNFVDTMGELLRVPVANYALGGAVTGAGRGLSPAGMRPQVEAFLSDRGPSAFPRLGGRFRSDDLVVISIGGNDARAYETSFGSAPAGAALQRGLAGAEAAAARSVANVRADVDGLVRAGARHIVFIGGDVGRLPEVKGTPVARIGSAFSRHYNQGVHAYLAGLAGQGVSAQYVDLNPLGDRIEADPAAFGLISAEACPQACLDDPLLADRYLFYVDRLHFTSAGFAIVGRYAVEQLRAARASRTAG